MFDLVSMVYWVFFRLFISIVNFGWKYCDCKTLPLLYFLIKGICSPSLIDTVFFQEQERDA